MVESVQMDKASRMEYALTVQISIASLVDLMQMFAKHAMMDSIMQMVNARDVMLINYALNVIILESAYNATISLLSIKMANAQDALETKDVMSVIHMVALNAQMDTL